MRLVKTSLRTENQWTNRCCPYFIILWFIIQGTSPLRGQTLVPRKCSSYLYICYYPYWRDTSVQGTRTLSGSRSPFPWLEVPPLLIIAFNLVRPCHSRSLSLVFLDSIFPKYLLPAPLHVHASWFQNHPEPRSQGEVAHNASQSGRVSLREPRSLELYSSSLIYIEFTMPSDWFNKSYVCFVNGLAVFVCDWSFVCCVWRFRRCLSKEQFWLGWSSEWNEPHVDHSWEEKSHQNPEKFNLTLLKRNKTRHRQQNGGYSVHMSSVALIIGFWTILFISNALLKVSWTGLTLSHKIPDSG